jgi:hypothetical protein
MLRPLATLLLSFLSTGNLDGHVPPSGVAFCGGTNVNGSFQAWHDTAAGVDALDDDLHIAPATGGQNTVDEVPWRTSTSSSYQTSPTIRHDEAGNLAFDGTYIYQYDAWNRLVQVLAGAVDPAWQPSPHSDPSPYEGLIFGPMVKHYTYDGLGRLIRTQSPFPDLQSAGSGEVRSERFYYDGIRRVQEVVIDPTMSMMMAMGSEDPQLQLLGEESLESAEAAATPGATIETGAATMELEGGLLENLEFEIIGPRVRPETAPKCPPKDSNLRPAD